MTVKTGKFLSGLKSANKGLGRFVKEAASVKNVVLGLSAAFAINSFKQIVDAQIAAIDSTQKLASAANVGVKDLTALRFAAEQNGVTAGELDATLLRVSRRVGLYGKGAGAAASGLKQLGFSQKELLGLSSDQQFKKIIEKIRQLPTASLRSAAAFEILGDSGQKFAQMIEGGSAGIDELTAEAERLGITFSQVDANQVAMASDALNRVSKISDGLKQQLTIQLAPIITAVANKFSNMAQSGFSAGKFITKGIEIMVKGIGMGADILHTFKLGFMLLQSAVTKGLAWFIRGWEWQGKAIEKVLNLLPGVEVSFSETLGAMADGLDELAKNQYADFNKEFLKDPPSKGINKFYSELKTESAAVAKEMADNANKGTRSFDEAAVKATRGISELIAKMQEQIDTFGMSGNAVEIWKLKNEGASDEMIKKAQELNKKLEGLADDKKLFDFGKSLTESFMTPLEKFEKELAKLREAKDKGFISENIFDKAVAKAQKELDKSGSGSGLKLAGATDYNSVAARSIILRSQSAGQQPINKVEKNTKDTLKEQKKSNKYLEKIAGTQNVIYSFGS
jgi:hypothetical protein